MISKIHSSDCKIGGDKCWPVIVIIHNEYTFSFNDSLRFGWQKDRDTFLCPKSKGWGIMVFEFLLLFGQLNLLSLLELS